MTTQTLVAPIVVDQVFTSAATPQRKYRQSKAGRNVLTLEGVAVFRSGTFRDSWGDQMTWEKLHIDQLVNNFNYLKSSQILPDVPVRKGHGALFGDPMDSLIGYTSALRSEDLKSPVDGQVYSYLLADYDILDPDAIEKIDSGLWRNRSAEVGHFTSNDEAMFWPTLVGFAYVDIPAVEGLNFNAGPGKLHEFGVYIAKNHKGDDGMATKDTKADSTDAPPAPPAAPVPPAPDAPVAPTEQPQAPVTGTSEVQPGTVGPLTDDDRPPTTPGFTVAEENETAIPPTEVQPGPVFGKNGQSFMFTIAGRQTNDFAAVQQHITTLETAASERAASERNEFCVSLASDNKILASDLDATKAFAASLSAEQYTAWKARQEALPTLSLFNRQSSVSGQQSGETHAFETVRDVVEQHRLSNMKPEAIRATESYKRMVELGDKLGLPYKTV